MIKKILTNAIGVNSISSMTPKHLLTKYGSAAEVARVFGYTRAAVALWIKAKRIPFRAQKLIELMSGGEFKAKP